MLQILRRTSYDEKYLVVCKQRHGHSCQFAVTVVAFIAWDAVSPATADKGYEEVSEKAAKYGNYSRCP